MQNAHEAGENEADTPAFWGIKLQLPALCLSTSGDIPIRNPSLGCYLYPLKNKQLALQGRHPCAVTQRPLANNQPDNPAIDTFGPEPFLIGP